jgi:hypothetical protein
MVRELLYLLILGFSLAEYEEITVGKMHHYFPEKCTGYHISANFKRLKFDVLCTSNIEWVKWSTTRHNYCMTKSSDEYCPLAADACGGFQGCSSSKQIIGSCVDDLWLYVMPKPDAEIMIYAEYKDEIPCNSIEENPYTQCGAQDFKTCNQCGGECRLAECMAYNHNKGTEYGLYHICLPRDTSDEEIKQRCLSHKSAEHGEWKKSCDEPLDVGSVGTGTVAVIGFLIVAYVGFIGVATWYNWSFKKTGRAPMRCPNLCPEILFPRSTLQARQESMSDDYRPPEIALTERQLE